jgi:Domain of unknown function (DUF4440)
MRKIQIVLICTACLFFITSTVTAQEAKNSMTNADVVEMVKAGLSEQIITTSIRQSLAKDFDLTPTGLIALKKAGVPDAIILIMQEVNASVKSVSTSGDKIPSNDSKTSPNNPNESVKQELMLVSLQGNKAWIAGDIETINKLLTDDFVQISDGKENNKAWMLKNAKPLKDITLDIENAELNLEGENATLTGTEQIYFKKGSMRRRFIYKFVKRDGQWLLATAKYDPVLAETQKTVTAKPPTDNGCSGIELMGLYKDDFRPVMPLIRWFAKVRNGTSVTRIVTVSWTNLYGVDKSFQSEVKPGDIATLEIARQNPVERQPISLRLSSCR